METVKSKHYLKSQIFSCSNDINQNLVKTNWFTKCQESDLNCTEIEQVVVVKMENEHQMYEEPNNVQNSFPVSPKSIPKIKEESCDDVDDLFVEGLDEKGFFENHTFIKLEPEDSTLDMVKSEITENVEAINETDVMEIKVEEGSFDNDYITVESNISPVKSECETDEYNSKIDVTGSFYNNDTRKEFKSVHLKLLNGLDVKDFEKEGHASNKNNGKVKHQCSYCAYQSSSKTYLQTHIALHEDPSQLVWHHCTKCTYKTRQKGHLKRHEEIHLDPEDAQVFICAICNSSFKQKCSLRRHIQFVHNNLPSNNTSNYRKIADTPFQCSSCSYSTYKKDLLVAHLDKHKENDPYICDICYFSTKYRRNLRMHLETHIDDEALKVFKCAMCKYKTRLRRCLKRHLQSKKHLALAGRLSDYRPRGVKD